MPWEPDYVTRDAAKAYMRITDDEDDEQVDLAVSMASRAVDHQAGRQFGLTDAPEAREYTARFSRARGGVWYVETDDYPDLSAAVVSWDADGSGSFATVVGAANCVPWPRNATVRRRPFERVFFRPAAPVVDGRAAGVRISNRWGWQSVPSAVPGAVLLQVSRMHARRDAPFGVAGSPDQGSEVRLLAKLDPDVAVAIRKYERRAWAR